MWSPSFNFFNKVDLATLDGKTLYQTTSTPAIDGNNSTNFNSEVRIKNNLTDKIILNSYWISSFTDDVNLGGNVEISKNLNVDGKQYNSDDLSVVGNISQTGNHNFVSGGITGAKIEYSQGLINLENKGTLGIRGGIINIGNADQTSVLNLNGIVNFNLYNTFGFNSVNGFISQFN